MEKQMREEVKAKLENVVYHIDELSRELRLDPAEDAQFSCRTLGRCLAQMNMRFDEMYGLKLMPVPLATAEASFTEGLETPTVT